MRQVLCILAMIMIVQSAHHLRHFQTPLLKGQATALIERQVQYIDDDVQLNADQDTQVNFEQQPVAQQDEVQRGPQEEAAVLQVDEEQQMSSSQIDDLDRKEQEEYDRQRRQRLSEEQLNDDGSYMSSTDDQKNVLVEAEDAMPIDVVEHQLTPTLPKDPIPDQKGVETPFAPADNSLPFQTYDSENGFEVKQSDIKMEGAVDASELDSVWQEEQRKEAIYDAGLHN